MRLRGADVLPQVETPNWQVPAGEEPATRASDAYKFALLAIRVIARDQDATDPAVLAGGAPALADLARESLRTDPAGRPAPEAWIHELQGAAQGAPTTQTIPSAVTPTATPASARAVWQGWNQSTRQAVGVIAAVVAVILVIAGLSTLGHHTTSSVSSAGSVSQTTAAPAPDPITTAPPSPTPSPSPTDPLAGAEPGDCYTNDGSSSDPSYQSDSSCQSGDFKVVQVMSDTTDLSACDGVSGSDMSTSDAAGDQVLCLMYQDSSPAYAATLNQCVFGPPGSDQTWSMTSCDAGNFTVVGIYPDTTDRGKCGSNSDSSVVFTPPGYSGLDEVLCLEMIFPYVATVQQYACLSQSGSGSDVSFAAASSCADANVVVEGRVFTPNDQSFCGQYAWYTWHSGDYPNLGVTVCLGSPNLPRHD
jgi:hypothetical protein